MPHSGLLGKAETAARPPGFQAVLAGEALGHPLGDSSEQRLDGCTGKMRGVGNGQLRVPARNHRTSSTPCEPSKTENRVFLLLLKDWKRVVPT